MSKTRERYYQQVRRCWRFGQKLPVNAHLVYSQAETSVVRNIERKESDAGHMAERIAEHMRDLMRREVVGVRTGGVESGTKLMALPAWFGSNEGGSVGRSD